MNYSAIYKADNCNGVGWRTVLFVSGCGHQCEGCHNKKSWDLLYGKEFTEETFNILVEQLKRPEIDGITLSGGDPLYKPIRDDILNLVKKIKSLFPDKTIWLYTGYKWEQVRDVDILEYVDIIVDGKFEQDKRNITLAFRGSSNQRIIDVKKSLNKENPVILDFDNGDN